MTENNGAFVIARKLFESRIWLEKPSSWKVIWIYILGKVSHKDSGNCERGEGFFQWAREIGMVGNDISKDSVKKVTRFLVETEMIRTRRSTRGVYIKVLNYNKYQTLDNYSSTAQGTKKALEAHQRSTTIDKNVRMKEDKNTTTQGVENIEVSSFIDSFKEVNPTYRVMFGRPNQRQACERLLKLRSLEEWLKVIKFIASRRGDRYCPRISTPIQLEQKYGDLETYALALKGKEVINKENIAFT